jgi:pimeloyl-ACP methyl ester carboxylesterase
MRFRALFAALSLSTFAAGCTGLSPGRVADVRPTSDHARAGNVYLLRGWIGVFSTGIDSMGGKLGDNGVRAKVYQQTQWAELASAIGERYRSAPNREPLVLVGHSYGADDVVRVARKLSEEQITVDLLVTIDPVTPPKVPSNVRVCLNLFQSNGPLDNLPFLRGIPLTPDEPGPQKLVNADIRKDRTDLLEPGVDHFNIEKKAKVQEEVLRHVLATCPPRQTWLAMRHLHLTPPAHGSNRQAMLMTQQGTQTGGGDRPIPE